ncbi:MAG TPA: trypsin-like peptidase domain-containing protein [Sphingobium sp.]|nr:trypsin-like peptidase domain-containing protein [Sphingobium sp.]
MTPRIQGFPRPLVAVLLGLLLAALPLLPARADTQDVAAASRSVVRVALVATDGDNAYFVGHGSGLVIAPDRVLTNAHVVELVRSEPNIVIGVIPSEGTKSYGGKIIAYSPGNDLALLAVEGGKLPVATFLAGAPNDGDHVTAIGYPGAVDRAQGMNLEDIIRPMSAVRTSGTVSAGRASKQFDTILHTAPLAAGNSGGPLIDDCGRVVGLNSFGSLSDGSDAEYGFAVSNREIASFLRQAGVQVQRSSEACRSMAEIEAAQQAADERARADADKRAGEAALAARERALAAREEAQQTTIVWRENVMALAAVLLALAAVAGGAAVFDHSKGELRRARLFAIGSGGLLLASILAFLLRPGFSAGEGPEPANAANGAQAETAAQVPGVGENVCRIDNALSRVTVSDTADVPFSWTAGGCLNGQTQFVQSAGQWSRVLVPAEEASISVRTFDPAIGRYRADKYLVGEQTVEQARALREKLGWSGCTADPERLAALARMQADIVALLPAQPNERLAYGCRTRQAEPAVP